MEYQCQHGFLRRFGAGAFSRTLGCAVALWLTPKVNAVAADANCDCDNQEPPADQLALNTTGNMAQNFDPGGRQTGADPAEPAPKYLDPTVPIEQRIDDLLPRMTLEEKVTELRDSWDSPGIPRLKIPAMLKTEGLHGQSYSTGATIFPMPIEMAGTFDPSLINRVGVATAVEAKAANLRVVWRIF